MLIGIYLLSMVVLLGLSVLKTNKELNGQRQSLQILALLPVFNTAFCVSILIYVLTKQIKGN